MGGACSAPPEEKKEDKKYQGELQGKVKYIGDAGAVMMQTEDKKSGAGSFTVLCFIDAAGNTVFVVHQRKNETFFVAELDDNAVLKVKDDCQISFTPTAIFKSIATDLLKGKAKFTPKGADTFTLEFSVTSVKDQKVVQKLLVDVPQKTSTSPHGLLVKYILTPLSWMVQKKRLNSEDREKEIKTSRLHTQGIIQDASIAKNRATVDRLQPKIVPLREESAAYAKASSELVAKLASVERKIRKLHSGKGKNPIDGVYEDGGARTFQHCPDAEEHVPVPKDPKLIEPLLDYIQKRLPLAEGEDMTAPAKCPSDPALAELYNNGGTLVQSTMKALQKLDEWDMSVFQIEKATDGNALSTVAYAMMYKLDLVNRLGLDDAKLRRFLNAVQSGYHPNPYHNATHAADVSQINYFIMTKGGLIDKCKLSQEEILGGILAGVIHDYDHPGFNNNFHTRTNAYLSTLYNDRSILENHHLACVFEMLRLERFNIFSHLKEEQYREIRETMTEMVLSTDMGLHGKIFAQFRRRLGEVPEWHERKEDIRLALSMSIKMADISNCGRPKHLYLEWAKNIATEFYNQGDVEQKLCIPISPFMDRRKDKQEFPKGQISFMNFIVVPMFEAISEFLPPVECSLVCCTENKEYWQQQE